ncbi:MAG: tryptophan-rich sensory protein [Burkholderiaceae bacterium]|nr:tryptophan-rich sensory protein [Microbacteriaceae bacterium]
MEKGSDVLRQVIVIICTGIAIVGSFIGSGAAGGTPIKDASGGALATDATLVAPGGAAFGIWTIIYVGLLGYSIWQSLSAQQADPRQRVLGYPIAASLALNAAWIMSIQFDLLALSVPVIIALLAVLIWTFLLTLRSKPKDLIESVIVDGTMGIYLGWVAIATAANITALLVSNGFDGFGLSADAWAIVVLALAAVAGILIAVRSHGRIAPAVALTWGLAWVAAARLTGDLASASTATAAIVAAVSVVGVTAAMRVRAGRRARTDSAVPLHA